MSQPKKGDVWDYEYLWRREHETGAEHGRKSRPSFDEFAVKHGIKELDLRINKLYC